MKKKGGGGPFSGVQAPHTMALGPTAGHCLTTSCDENNCPPSDVVETAIGGMGGWMRGMWKWGWRVGGSVTRPLPHWDPAI